MIEDFCQALRCSDKEKIQYVPLQLRGLAAEWWGAYRHSRMIAVGPIMWDQFRLGFETRFLSVGNPEVKIAEFDRLRQTKEMSVREYDAQFIRLYRFTPYLVPTE